MVVTLRRESSETGKKRKGEEWTTTEYWAMVEKSVQNPPLLLSNNETLAEVPEKDLCQKFPIKRPPMWVSILGMQITYKSMATLGNGDHKGEKVSQG